MLLRNVRYCARICCYARATRSAVLSSGMVLRFSYAVCGTELGYGASQAETLREYVETFWQIPCVLLPPIQ
eukprot:84188-Rhodomonas_salina.1